MADNLPAQQAFRTVKVLLGGYLAINVRLGGRREQPPATAALLTYLAAAGRGLMK